MRCQEEVNLCLKMTRRIVKPDFLDDTSAEMCKTLLLFPTSLFKHFPTRNLENEDQY